MAAPAYVAYTVLGGSLAILAALVFGAHRALARAGWPPGARASVWRGTSVILILWFATALTLSWCEFFRATSGRFPTIALGVFIPVIGSAVALWRSRTLRRIIDAVPQPWLVGVQFFRTMGVVFLILFGAGRLPGAFALPAGIGDVLVGIEAPLVALMYARGARHRERLARAWNVFGILDLMIAIGTGFATSPSPLQLLSLEAPNTLITAFPLVMIPVFAAPVAILLHLMSLMKLRQTRAQLNSPRGVAVHAF